MAGSSTDAPENRRRGVSGRSFELQPGAIVANKYRIESVIGSGGQGSVHRATRLADGEAVALKVLHVFLGGSATDLKRFEREAEILQRLRHSCIVRLLDSGKLESGAPFIVFEHLQGYSVREEIRRGSLPVDRLVKIARAVLDGLEAAHAISVIHRDIKPANIFFCDTGEIRLLDFGIAKAMGAESSHRTKLTATGQMIGTPHYLSPEQAFGGAVGPSSDLYSLGLVMAEMLSGVKLVAGDNVVEILMAQGSQSPHVLPAAVLGSPLATVVARAVEKRPERRFSSVKEMRAALDAALAGEPRSGSLPLVNKGVAPTAILTPLADTLTTGQVPAMTAQKRLSGVVEKRVAARRVALIAIVAAVAAAGLSAVLTATMFGRPAKSESSEPVLAKLNEQNSSTALDAAANAAGVKLTTSSTATASASIAAVDAPVTVPSPKLFEGEYTWSDGIKSGRAKITEDGNAVVINYGIGIAHCKAQDKRLSCTWNDSGARGPATLVRQDNGQLVGSWSLSRRKKSGPFNFWPKKP